MALQSRSSSRVSGPEGHHHIQQLTQDVINRIAAGEVVQRPSAALKEMLENSIDAGSTRVQVFCQDGGLTLLQITDDGSGIFKDDLPLLCERFATSKIRTFDDLEGVMSFGFRGEALASISHVAQVSVVTMRRSGGGSKTRDNDGATTQAWTARFADGAMVTGPTICAGNPGTTIRVENLFYNTPVRKASLGKPTEEYARILDLVQKYSFCFPSVAFSCRHVLSGSSGPAASSSTGSAKFDFTSPCNGTLLANLRTVHGASVAKHLLALEEVVPLPQPLEVSSEVEDNNENTAAREVQISGYLSDATFLNKRSQVVIFVNQRLVDSPAIRRCLDQVYAPVLTGGNRYDAFLRLTVPPKRVDVNIHPTKHEVLLMDEDLIMKGIATAARRVLAASSAAKQLHVGQIDYETINLKPVSNSSTNVSTTGHRGVVVAPCTMTRVEQQRGDMLKYVVPVDRFALLDEDQRRKSKLAANASEIATGPLEIGMPQFSPVNVDEDDESKPHQGCPPSGCSGDEALVGAFSMEKALQMALGDSDDDDAKDAADFRCMIKTRDASGVPPADKKRSRVDDGADDVMSEFHRFHHPTTQPLAEQQPSQASPQQLTDAAPAPLLAAASLPAAAPGGVPLLHSQVTDGLTSVATVVAMLSAQCSEDVSEVFAKMVFVGILNRTSFFAQSGTTLFSVRTAKLAQEVVFQRLMTNFGNHPQATFVDGSAPDVATLLRFAYTHDLNLEEQQREMGVVGGHLEVLLRQKLRTLRRWRGMLSEYFGIEMHPSPNKRRTERMDEASSQEEQRSARQLVLARMPLVLGSAWPLNHRAVPRLLWKLASDVRYEVEEPCLVHIARHISVELFGRDGLVGDDAAATALSPPAGAPLSVNVAQRQWYDAIRFGLMPCCSGNSVPSSAARDARPTFFPTLELFTGHVVRSVVTVEALYKVFERC